MYPNIRHFLFTDVLDQVRLHFVQFEDIRNSCVSTITGDLDNAEQFLALKYALEQWISIVGFFNTWLPLQDKDNVHIGVTFTWGDPFVPTKVYNYGLFMHEMLGTLYNVGATYCNLGFVIDRNSSNEARKQALSYFQKGASVFQCVLQLCEKLRTEDNIVFSSVESLAITIEMFCTVAYGQIQTCVYEKAVKDDLSRSLLSKLAYQVAEYFLKAVNCSKRLEVLPLNLAQWFRAQRLAFLGAAHYQKSLVDLEEVRKWSEGYGAVIARLRVAKRCCEEAKDAEASDVFVDISKLHEACDSALSTLEHDNKTVYLEVVPSESQLPALQGATAVKVEEFKIPSLEDTLVNGRDILHFFKHNGRPVASVELCEELKRKCSILFGPLTTKLKNVEREFTTLCRSKTPIYYLWANNRTNMDSLLKAICKRAVEIEGKGGRLEIKKRLDRIQCDTVHCNQLIATVEEVLHDLSELVITGEQTFFSALKESAAGYKRKLKEAVEANKLVEQRYDTVSLLHDIPLCKDDIDRSLENHPVDSSLQGTFAERLCTWYDTIIGYMDRVRHNTTCDIKSLDDEKTQEFDVVVFRKMSLSPVKDRFLEECEKHLKEALDWIELSNKSVAEMSAYWASSTDKQARLASVPRLVYLQHLDRSTQDMVQLFLDTEDGLSFFSNLISHLTQLHQKITSLRSYRESRYMEQGNSPCTATRRYAYSSLNLSSAPSLLPISRQTHASWHQRRDSGVMSPERDRCYPHYPSF